VEQLPAANGFAYTDMHPSSPQNGDLSGDNQTTPTDAALAIAAGGGSASCDAATFAAADVNHDGQVTSSGALMILQGWLGDTPNYRKTINTLKKVRRKLK